MKTYKVLQQQVFTNGNFSLVPIRYEDRYDIMQWRNEQIYHLRQDKPLTLTDQDKYFDEVVSQLFEEDKPKQILFSFLEGEHCIGYGGLVHINWVDRNTELSFIMDTALEAERFDEIWSAYLSLIERVAFEELHLHKVYTYAFDLRPNLYPLLEKNSFFQDARLNGHAMFDGKYVDVVIHSKINPDERHRSVPT